LARKLTLGYLLSNSSYYSEAEHIARQAGLGGDQNIAVALGYDRERQRYFESRIARFPDNVNALNNLGFNYWKQGKYDAAITQFERAIQTKPDFANAHVNLALALVDACRFDEAVKILLELRTLNPTQEVLALIKNELAIVRALRKRGYLGRSSSLALELARAYWRRGQSVEAIKMLGLAAAESEDIKMLSELGAHYESSEFVDEALDIYERMAALAPDNASIQRKVNEGRLFRADRNARQRWLNSREIVFYGDSQQTEEPASCVAWTEVWNEYEPEGSIQERQLRVAVLHLEECIQSKSDDREAYRSLATIRELLGEYSQAASIWKRSLEKWPVDAVASLSVKRLELLRALNESDYDMAEEVAMLTELGDLHEKGGEWELGLNYLEQAAKKSPGNAGIWERIGRSREATGEYPKALTAYERATELQDIPGGSAVLDQRLAAVREIVAQQ